jgi:prenyltransferase beta subunit
MLRTYEAGIGVMILLVALTQFVMLSAGRLGEQWDSTELDVEVKKALGDLQMGPVSDALNKYSKIRDPGLLQMPDNEIVGYRILVNGEPVDKTLPPEGVEVATADGRVYHLSRDAPRLVRSFLDKLLRSDYVQTAGRTMDYDSVDELADLILGLIWDEESHDILVQRVRTLIENQNGDGGWGFVVNDESNTLCTSMAIRAISAWIKSVGGDPLGNSTVTDGISWLKSRVHADMGYGSKERVESSVDMTAHTLLAYMDAGLDQSDQWVEDAIDFLLRLQRPDGGFPINRRATSQAGPTALAMSALMAANGSQSAIESASDFLSVEMVGDGEFSFDLVPTGDGTYDLVVYTGYVVDCSPRGHEFWGEHVDDSRIAIVDVYGDRDNMTVVLRIERGMLDPPESKQKIALAFSHNQTPDDTDWWILNAGNPHTAGQGAKLDDPKWDQEVVGAYTYLTITDLEVPDEYNFFNQSEEDYLLAIVGDENHPIKDNPGWGYLVGYWSAWMAAFDYNTILAWRAWSPRVNRVVLDVDEDWEFDDRRLMDGDSVWVRDSEWELEIWENDTGLNLSFVHAEYGYVRWYWPRKYDLSTIPASKSGLYHFGVISVLNKPAMSKDYKVVLRDSVERGVYDEAYIWDGFNWDYFPEGSVWTENGTRWVVGIEDDFLTLTRASPITISGITGWNTTNLTIEGDFIEVRVDRHGPEKVWMTLYQDSVEVDRAIFADSLDVPFRQLFGTWGAVRESSMVYETLAMAERWLHAEANARSAHDTADLGQQAIKFNKIYNSVIGDRLSIQAWYKSGAGEV